MFNFITKIFRRWTIEDYLEHPNNKKLLEMDKLLSDTSSWEQISSSVFEDAVQHESGFWFFTNQGGCKIYSTKKSYPCVCSMPTILYFRWGRYSDKIAKKIITDKINKKKRD